MIGKIVFGVLVLAAIAGYSAVHSGAIAIPPQWNPWAPLEIAAPDNVLTRFKLGRLSQDAPLCQAVLATTPFDYEQLSDRDTGPGCGFRNAVRIDRTAHEVSEAFSMTCPAAVSLALWEHHIVQPAAQKHFGEAVARLEHFGSYSCRNIYGGENAARSQHATAQALDVAGFILADGSRIRVVNDWRKDDASAAFLREVRDGACRYFDAVLSPDYNAAHRDHLHVDRGRYRVCR